MFHRFLMQPLTLSTLVLLAGCGGGGGDSSNPQTSPIAARPVDQSDQQIASAVFAGQPRTPPGFYAESAPSGMGVVATKHLKNSDINGSLGNAAEFELCTNDWNEALAWSETSAQTASQYGDLVATNDEARFFEFGRMQAGVPQVYVQARVYKCAYLDRTNADLRTSSGAAGSLNIRPITAAELQRVSEYVWQFTAYNNFGNVVLNSVATNGASLSHTLHIAKLMRGGLSPSCDRIDVIAWKHNVDPANGALTLSAQTLWSFGAREQNGLAQLCSS